MTVAELIHMYRLRTTPARPCEDERHAQWWVERLGPLPLADLTAAEVLHAGQQLKTTGRAANTVNMYLRFFRRVTTWGTGMLYLSSDLCAGIQLEGEPSPPMRIVTEDEERQLCEAFGRPYNLWIRFAILTGLKQAEQFTLCWSAVHLTRGHIRVPNGACGAETDLLLPPNAITVLSALRDESPASPWVFPHPANPTQHADPHNFYGSRWTRTIRRLGLPPIAWKDLRNTCGVRLAQQGWPVADITTFLRQREIKQAYLYRAWQSAAVPRKPRLHHPRVPVFSDVTAEGLQALMARDLTTTPMTFGEVSRLYAVHHLQGRPSRVQFEQIYKNLFRQWYTRPLSDLSRKEVRLWYMGLARTPGHANKALTFLRRVYNVAIDLELYNGTNPACRIPRYFSNKCDRFLSIDEAHRFMAGLPHISPKPRAYMLLLLLTGSRLSEARRMRWDDVEWSTRLWRKPRTKNGTSQFVPLPVQLVDALAQIPRRSEWVFDNGKGQPWARTTVQALWEKLRRSWKIEDVTIHDLRRTCASYLAISGENLPTIQNVLNHTNLAHTAIYARLNTKDVDRALQTQADRLCSLVQEPIVLPALKQELTPS